MPWNVKLDKGEYFKSYFDIELITFKHANVDFYKHVFYLQAQ